MLNYRRLSSVVVVSVALAACAGTSTRITVTTKSQALKSTSPSQLMPPEFSTCGVIECADFVVPVDYEDPSDGQLVLKVYRRKGSAAVADKQTVVVHPGGPGTSVSRLLEDFPAFFGTKAENFDVIGLSTRGSSDGDAAECIDGLDLVVDASSSYEAARAIADGCKSNSGGLIGHLGTRDTVRDLESLRSMLKLTTVAFMGWSYGATVGAVWAMSYPSSLNSVVLDAPVDPSRGWSGQFATQMAKQQTNLRKGLDLCDVSPTCEIGPQSIVRLRRLAIQLEQHPMKVESGGRTVDEKTLAIAAELKLYGADFDGLFSAIAAAERGDAQQIALLADARLGRGDDGVDDGGIETQILVRCSDITHAEASSTVDLWDSRIPFDISVGLGAAIERVCLQLPEPPRPLGSIMPVDGAFEAPVLVIASDGDPVVPASSSRALAERLTWGINVLSSIQHLAVGFDQQATTAAIRCLSEKICQ